VHKVLAEDGSIRDEDLAGRLAAQLSGFREFIAALKGRCA
jgi:hypothetical protein